jgi:hypothetical protein
MEYVILFVVVALAALAVYGKYGRTAGGKVGGAGKRVETLGSEQGAYVSETGSSGGGGSTAEGGGSSTTSANVDALPQPVGATKDGGRSTIDTRTVILLGIAALAIGALMILAMFQRVRKVKKKPNLQR